MKIGEFDTEKRVFIIAEAGVNHNGNMSEAYDLIRQAKTAGADAVKFQCFSSALFPEPQRSICKPLELNYDQLQELHGYAKHCGIMWLCTPFDRDAVDFLDPLVPAFKIGSGQARDMDFVGYVAGKGKPMILSTGMMKDYRSLPESIKGEFAILHCVSRYPTPPEMADLTRMNEWRCDGYSDHTKGIEITVAAVALGARIIEKHITLDRTQAGPDHTSSAEPRQFADMVRMIRNVEKAIK